MTWVLVFLAGTLPAHAFIPVRSSQNGAEVRWGDGAQLTFRANTTNSSGLTASDLFQIFTTSLSRWKQAAFDGFAFTYYQGTNTSLYPNYVGSPQDSSIFFTSNAGSSDQLPCGVIGLTQIWFDPGSGIASKADVRFNDVCYRFTLNPSDTQTQSRIYLGDVATHELGHALGLDHSQNLQSSLIFTAALEMSLPSCDDQAAMVHLYGGGARGRTGTLTGRVSSGTGAVFGAHVSAIQLERGVVLASTLSDRDGSFAVSGLEPGHYGIVVEPYYPGASSLASYYSGVSSNVCGGAQFDRTFALAGGKLRSLAVSAGGQADIGTITVSCSAPGSANGSSETSFYTAPVLAASNLGDPVGTQSSFSSSSDHYYRLAAQSGHLVANALAFTLFSRSDVQVELLDSAGRRIPGSLSSNVFSSSSGYVDYDASATADLSTAQDVYLHVYSRSSLSSYSFPSGSIGVSGTPYYALTVSRGTPTSSVYAANARCETADAFSAYVSRGDAPPFGREGDEDEGAAGCGTLAARGDNGGPGGPGETTRLLNFAAVAALLAFFRSRMRQQLPLR